MVSLEFLNPPPRTPPTRGGEIILQENMNQAIFQRLVTLSHRNRLAHAYLFVGQPRTGKIATALSLAKFFNCENPLKDTFCDQCPSCVKVNSSNHPDIHFVEAQESDTIKIEQIRELISQIQLRPLLGKKKIFIIRHVENLTLEGANAFLKTLEEPSVNSLLLLTTSVLENNLDTIRSRCHVIFFPQPMGEFLSPKMREKAEEMIDGFILSPGNEPFLKRILQEKSDIKVLLDVLLGWIRDCLLLKSGISADGLINQKRFRDLDYFVQKRSFKELEAIEADIVKTFYLLKENLNMKIPLLLIKEKL